MARQRWFSLSAITLITAVAVVTGSIWRVAVDHGGTSAGNPISRYGPHWLYPTVTAIAVTGLLIVLLGRRRRSAMQVGLTAITAGGISNLAQWLILGGVSNPFGPVPGIHGSGQLSIGDVCLWIGGLTILGSTVIEGRRQPAERT
jgi:lipoprotein signal peptidase